MADRNTDKTAAMTVLWHTVIDVFQRQGAPQQVITKNAKRWVPNEFRQTVQMKSLTEGKKK